MPPEYENDWTPILTEEEEREVAREVRRSERWENVLIAIAGVVWLAIAISLTILTTPA